MRNLYDPCFPLGTDSTTGVNEVYELYEILKNNKNIKDIEHTPDVQVCEFSKHKM
jgi:hypothetical protein